jgi:alpha-beta hydrolase superfamily lysophospholipase
MTNAIDAMSLRGPSRLATLAVVALCLTAFIVSPVRADPIAVGKGQLTIDIDGTAIDVYTYKPERYTGGAVLLTLHGVGRNAEGYRDHAIPLAERHGLLVAAPRFDRERFPTWRYQHGAIARRPARGASYQALPEDEHTGPVFLKIVEAIRTVEGKRDAPFYLLGHSGGGQALSRVAGFLDTGAKRIVIANPGSYLWPSLDVAFPDGYGGLPQARSDAALRRYLAQPITLLLGTADVKQDADLTLRESAAAQGANRYERGHNAYRAAQSLANARGWAFNWKLIEVPGVGHSARRMFGSDAAASAFE